MNDYAIVLEGLRSLLSSEGSAMDVVEMDLNESGPQRRVDVTLLDTYGSVGPLSERVRVLCADASNGAVLVFSFSDRPAAVRQAVQAGARGLISKAVHRDQIIGGIKAAANGERVILTQRSRHAGIDASLQWPGRELGLTERESQLLALLRTGMTNRQLAQHLFVSENTIKTQLRSLYAKTGARNRAQAVALGEQGILGEHRRD